MEVNIVGFQDLEIQNIWVIVIFGLGNFETWEFRDLEIC